MRSEEKEEDEGEPPKLDWKDYVAFVIALLQTALLPFLIIIGVLVVAVIVLFLTRSIHLIIPF